jgi:pyridoxine 5-phosphate synthase
MTQLSVNINKFATLRNARGGNNPDLVKVAIDCQRFGAQGITIHPRPDQRHIRYSDVPLLKEVVHTEFNIEGYPSEDFIQLIEKTKPDQTTLVPDPPDALTSNAGWDCINHSLFLKETIKRLKQTGTRVSIFLEHSPTQAQAAAETGADRIELYTEPYASTFTNERSSLIQDFATTAITAQQYGLGINAGHDLSLENLAYFKSNIPGLLEVSIGHALVCDALYFGLENTIQLYLRQLKTAIIPS